VQIEITDLSIRTRSIFGAHYNTVTAT